MFFIIYIIFIIFLLIYINKKKLWISALSYVTFLYFVIGYIPQAIYLYISKPTYISEVDCYYVPLNLNRLDFLFLLLTISLLFFLLSYIISKPLYINIHYFKFNYEELNKKIFTFLKYISLFIGLLLLYLSFKTSFYFFDFNGQQELKLFFDLLPLTYLIFTGIYLSGKKKPTIYEYILFSFIYIFQGLLVGAKSRTIIIVYYGIIYTYRKYKSISSIKIDKSFYIIFIVFLLLLTFVFPFVDSYRINYVMNENLRTTSFFDTISINMRHDSFNFKYSLERLFSRQSYTISSYIMINASKDTINFYKRENPKFTEYIFYSFIPRIIWKNKPILSNQGRSASYIFYGIPANIKTSAEIPFVADSFVLGGLIGLLLFSIFWGCLCKLIDNISIYNSYNFPIIAIKSYLIVFVSNIFAEGGTMVAFAGIVSIFIRLLVILYIFHFILHFFKRRVNKCS